ncbi:cupin domain-containing protein [Tenacibaculum xiamenense]|uniref:cupin domain-containing protein n=1 Tax=Tenacibaculum xiamenense TaxID=1261553 RepID=UPI0038931596
MKNQERKEGDRRKASSAIQIDNEKVRVTSWLFEPNTETGWHKHAYNYIVVPQSEGTLSIQNKETKVLHHIEKGKSYYRELGVEHNVINENNYCFSFIEIELK